MASETPDQLVARYEKNLAIDFLCPSRLMYAMSLLSDAQEELDRGSLVLANDWINEAKYHIAIQEKALCKYKKPDKEGIYR